MQIIARLSRALLLLIAMSMTFAPCASGAQVTDPQQIMARPVYPFGTDIQALIKPGLYLTIEWHGPFTWEGNGFGVLRVDPFMKPNQLTGSLEMVQITNTGEMMDLKSRVIATVDHAPCPTTVPFVWICEKHTRKQLSLAKAMPRSKEIPLRVLDEPLKSMLGQSYFQLYATDIGIVWQGSKSMRGWRDAGRGSGFVAASESYYRYIANAFRLNAAHAKERTAISLQSLKIIRERLEDFMNQSKRWLTEDPYPTLLAYGNRIDALVAQGTAYFKASQTAKTRLTAMKMYAVYYDVQQYEMAWDSKRKYIDMVNQDVGNVLNSESSCFDSSAMDMRLENYAPEACAELFPLVTAYKKRIQLLNAKLFADERKMTHLQGYLQCVTTNFIKRVGAVPGFFYGVCYDPHIRKPAGLN